MALIELGGSDRPGELYYNFSTSNDLTQMVNFPIWIPDYDFHSPPLLDLFLSSENSFFFQLLFFHWEILIILLSQFLLAFFQTQNRMPHFIAWLMTILVLIRTIFMII